MEVCLALLLLLLLFWTGDAVSVESYETVEETETHSDNDTGVTEETEDLRWLATAVLDVAYYLRRHKFSGYDRRLHRENLITQRNLQKSFPRPPLKAPHWEVKKHCEATFVDCVRYLQQTVNGAELTRYEDSVTVIRENGWTEQNEEEKMKIEKARCLDALKNDSEIFQVFDGPLEKFQWLISASYFMCWYTMRARPQLAHFNAPCDDHAACLGPNSDPRADDGQPFACALYSFCPDPCCPRSHVRSYNDCLSVDPCLRHTNSSDRCSLRGSDNEDLMSLELNLWNISCSCTQTGYRWESQSGMCVDVDECTDGGVCLHAPSESCLNTPGSYRCVCSPLGYRRDPTTATCVPDPYLQAIINPQRQHTSSPTHRPWIDKFQSMIHRLEVFWKKKIIRSAKSSASIADIFYLLLLLSFACLTVPWFHALCSLL